MSDFALLVHDNLLLRSTVNTYPTRNSSPNGDLESRITAVLRFMKKKILTFKRILAADTCRSSKRVGKLVFKILLVKRILH